MIEHHRLTVRSTGAAEMAYVGARPWHGLGQQVTKGASIGVWRKEAGLDWDALSSPVQYADGAGQEREFPGFRVLSRSDTGAGLGIVSDRFNVVQPADVLEFFRDLTEVGGWHIHTAGSLKGGSKIWAMASHDSGGGFVNKHDRVVNNLLLATALDGSMKTVAMSTPTRVVCWNTFTLALRSASSGVQISHREQFDPASVKASLGVAVKAFDGFMQTAREMADTPVSVTEATEVLRELFGQPTEKELNPAAPDFEFQRIMAQISGAGDGTRLREQRSVQRSLALFSGEGMGSQLPGSPGTRWGLFNAVTQHIDHEMGRRPDTRVESAWFGRGASIKQQTLDLLTA